MYNNLKNEEDKQVINTTAEINIKIENEDFIISPEEVKEITNNLDEALKEFEENDYELELQVGIGEENNNIIEKIQENEEVEVDNEAIEVQNTENQMVEKEKNNKSNNFNIKWTDISNMKWVDNLLATLSVDYNNLNVLLEETPSLKLVDYYFDSVTCRK